MGARLVRFNFIPKENEQIDAIIKIPEEKRSIIHGVVKDWCNKVVKDAVVKLFEVEGCGSSCILKPITHTFTDECGQFLFGPLCAHRKYTIKIWFNDIKVRELIITPEDNCNCDDQHNNMNDNEFEHCFQVNTCEKEIY